MILENEYEQTILRTFLKEHPITDSWNDKLIRELIQKSLIEMPKLVKYEIDEIIGTVCNVFNISKELIFKKIRYRDNYVFPRFFIWYYLRQHTSLSYSSIGRLTGNFDHATVIHGRKKVIQFLENKDKDILLYYEKIENEFKQLNTKRNEKTSDNN